MKTPEEIVRALREACACNEFVPSMVTSTELTDAADMIEELKARHTQAAINYQQKCRDVAELERQLAELQKDYDIMDAANIALHGALAASQRREKAAVKDLSTYKDCGVCTHLQDQQYCHKYCQNHVNVDNFRTHPCWQWRGQAEGDGE